MNINYEKLSGRIGDFLKWFSIILTANVLSQPFGSVHLTGLSYIIFPLAGSLFMTLFFSEKAPWPIYKKGEKVWWSTYGTETSARQKVLMTFIFLSIFIILKIVN
jgi:hypothetical protein